MDLLTCIRKRATKMTPGMEHLSYEDRLRELRLCRLEKAEGGPESSLFWWLVTLHIAGG